MEVRRPATKRTAWGTAAAMPPFVLLWEVPVRAGAGEPVELDLEDDDIPLLLSERLEDGPDEREERAEDGELPLSRIVPFPQGILSPFGWVV